MAGEDGTVEPTLLALVAAASAFRSVHSLKSTKAPNSRGKGTCRSVWHPNMQGLKYTDLPILQGQRGTVHHTWMLFNVPYAALSLASVSLLWQLC